jgi:hypothetical protein
MIIIGGPRPSDGKEKIVPAELTVDDKIKQLWRRHMDTRDIAIIMHLPESEVANRLAAIRDAGK